MRHLLLPPLIAALIGIGLPAAQAASRAAPGAGPVAAPIAVPSLSCEALAEQAAARHGLPAGLLTAIAHTESGRGGKGGVQSWPWTANVRGKGYFFASKEAALEHLGQLVAKGVKDFDVGCMQLNYRWHGGNFADLAQMIDPARNTDYAARYLDQLRSETGDWDHATRYYHSRDADLGKAYLRRVKAALARIDPAVAQRLAAQQAAPPKPAMAPPGPTRARAATAPAGDRRFVARGPLVALATPAAYWDRPALPQGNLPRLPPLRGQSAPGRLPD